MLNKFLVLFISGLISCLAHSEVFTSIGENNVFEREAYATQYANRTPLAVRLGYQVYADAIFAEYNQFHSSDGVSQLQIFRTHHELLVWARHSFWSEQTLQLYVQAAPGIQLEHIDTNFMSASQSDTSKPYVAFATAVGAAIQIEKFRFELELRGLASQNAAPNPTLSVGFYGGYLF